MIHLIVITIVLIVILEQICLVKRVAEGESNKKVVFLERLTLLPHSIEFDGSNPILSPVKGVAGEQGSKVRNFGATLKRSEMGEGSQKGRINIRKGELGGLLRPPRELEEFIASSRCWRVLELLLAVIHKGSESLIHRRSEID